MKKYPRSYHNQWCREWVAPGEMGEAVGALISLATTANQDGHVIAFTGWRVSQERREIWLDFLYKGDTVGEGASAVEVTASSMVMEIKTCTAALKHLLYHGFHNHRLDVHLAKSWKNYAWKQTSMSPCAKKYTWVSNIDFQLWTCRCLCKQASRQPRR